VDVRNIDANSKGYSDWSAGVNLRNKMGKKGENVLNVGLSAEHLLQPKYNLVTNTISKLPLRLNIYGTMDMTLNKTFMLYPALIFRTAKNQSETMAQTMLGMKLDPKKNLIVKAGLGYRIGDAAQFLAGAEFGDFRAGLAYDFTASTLRKQTNIQDGFEIAVSYIGKIFKKQQPPPTILCPKY
jgi:opacity protein-like surface antigen